MRVLICLILCATNIQAQYITGVATKWSDSYAAWDLFTTAITTPATDSTEQVVEDLAIGFIQQRWLDAKEDWTEWDMEIGDRRGTIKLKWRSDPSQWELRTFDGEIITMKTIWSSDITQWRVTNGSFSLDFKSRYTSDYGEWNATSKTYGNFQVAVKYANDPRDWVISDELTEEVPVTLKIAMLFLAIYHSSPKE